jgi:trans-2,3-dihydro-3-hydroxyanthranilate isomerase
MPALPYTILDVFTDTPLQGNALAVFTDAAAPPSDATMQRLARELNLSETAFALPAQAGGDVRIRIFTPSDELPFAGHPTLGAAVALAAERELIELETGAGTVPVSLERAGGRIVGGRMAQPLPTIAPFDGPLDTLLAALGVARAELPVEVYVNGPRTVCVALEDELAVAALAPNMQALAGLGANVSCFAPAGGYWKVRVFGPALGVDEDPATGSAAGPLALHLARHGAIAFGQEIEIHQGEEIGRPSVLRARADGNAERVERIEVAGAAVIVGRGTFELGG